MFMDPSDAPDIKILRQTTRTARKGRWCECGKWMPAGTRYTDVAGTEDGSFFSSVRCEFGHCPNVAPTPCKRCNGGGYDPEFGCQDTPHSEWYPDLCHDCGGRGEIPS